MNFTALLTAGRVVECEEIASLSYYASDNRPFSIFISPASGSSLSVGDVVTVKGLLANGVTATAPVIVGEWSPVVFVEAGLIKDLAGNTLSISTDYRAWAAPMTID